MPSSSVPSLAYSDFSPPSTSVSLLQTPRTQADLLPDYPFDTIRTPAYRIPSDTPGQRGDRIWVRPIFCRGGWILRDRLSSGYTDLVCAARLDSAGWMTLGPVMVWEGEGCMGAGQGVARGQNTHSEDTDWIWVSGFWTGGYAAPKANLVETGYVDVLHRVRTNGIGQVTFEHAMDPRREFHWPDVSILAAMRMSRSQCTCADGSPTSWTMSSPTPRQGEERSRSRRTGRCS